MATQSEKSEMMAKATEIKTATAVGENTALRVGGLLEQIVDALPVEQEFALS